MVKISDIVHPGGMPAMDGATINFGSIAITLNKADYAELAAAIGDKAASDLNAAQRVYDKHWERVKATSALVKDIRDLLYDGGEDDDFFVRRELKEIDEKKLDSILEQNSRLLGFE